METKVNFTKEFRRVNGFRILIVCVEGSFPIYAIHPNETNLTFYFRDFTKAYNFAMHFQNSHKDAFWFRRWSKLHSLQYVAKLNSSYVIPY